MSSARQFFPQLARRLIPPHRLRSVYERVLGTELEVQVVADTRARAGEAERAALDKIDRLTGILNRFDPASELRRWWEAPPFASHPGADAFIDTRTGKYTVNMEAQGAVAVLNNLHRGRDVGVAD